MAQGVVSGPVSSSPESYKGTGKQWMNFSPSPHSPFPRLLPSPQPHTVVIAMFPWESEPAFLSSAGTLASSTH